ncbi:hypothetical protein B0H10DRAFT_1966268 [Mycena sp. CBHHK59/15]|nr:hypothetical protein B0H10DRAFT_1966268 [Mycena sp. CBHHK59/15]
MEHDFNHGKETTTAHSTGSTSRSLLLPAGHCFGPKPSPNVFVGGMLQWHRRSRSTSADARLLKVAFWVKAEISIYWPGIARYGLKIWVWGPYTQLGNRGILPYLPILQMRSQLGKVVWVKAEISIYWPGIAWYGLKISETVGYYVSNPGIWSHIPLSQLQPDTLGQIGSVVGVDRFLSYHRTPDNRREGLVRVRTKIW